MRIAAALCALTLVALSPERVGAQEPPKPIGPFAIDVRGTIPRFPSDQQLADSRGLLVAELPGSGFGLDLGAHLYLFKWKAVTFGAGGQVTFGRSHSSEQDQAGIVVARAVTEHLTAFTPQISFNFGSGAGWSYLSGGAGPAVWSIVPDGQEPLFPDEERLIEYNYGGGARWFARPHLAFTFDVRIHAITKGTPVLGYPPSPFSRMVILGAGVSLK